jgi:hypothetical protein
LLIKDPEILLFDQLSFSSMNILLDGMEQAIAIVQHHDAITGTMKERIKVDYEKRLIEGRNMLDTVLLLRFV